MTRTPARPVTALRHALWRRRLRSARSSSYRQGAGQANPKGTAAALTYRSAGRTSVRPLFDDHAETTEVSASCVATVAAYERAHDAGHHRLVGQRSRAQGAHERLRRRGRRHEQGGLLGMPAQHRAGGPPMVAASWPAQLERATEAPTAPAAGSCRHLPSRLPTRHRLRHRRPVASVEPGWCRRLIPGGDLRPRQERHAGPAPTICCRRGGSPSGTDDAPTTLASSLTVWVRPAGSRVCASPPPTPSGNPAPGRPAVGTARRTLDDRGWRRGVLPRVGAVTGRAGDDAPARLRPVRPVSHADGRASRRRVPHPGPRPSRLRPQRPRPPAARRPRSGRRRRGLHGRPEARGGDARGNSMAARSSASSPARIRTGSTARSSSRRPAVCTTSRCSVRSPSWPATGSVSRPG